MTRAWWRDDAIEWQSAAWSLELRGDELAEIRHHGTLMLRAVRATVRDDGWLTIPTVVEERSTTPSSLSLRLRHQGLGAHLASTLSVAVEGDALRISWDAENLTPFQTNRAGLVVLHPASDTGASVLVTHDDGTTEQATLPREIRPHQPIIDIRELHIDRDGASTNLRFEGDVFEMEDQRNWTDASFKTYSRPLSLPFPYPLAAGARVQQSIAIRGAVAEVVTPDAVTPDTAPLIVLSEAGTFPRIGVEASTAPDPVPASSAGSFRVVELNLLTPNWRAALERAALDGRQLDVRVVTEDEVTGQEAAALDAAVRALAQHEVVRVTAFDAISHISDEQTVTALRAALTRAQLDRPVLAGSRSHFTELNREQHRIPRNVDGMAVNTTPLFHTLDTEQLVEAVAMQRLIAAQTVRIADGLPVHIGPIALRPRFNNVATASEPAPIRTDLADGYGASGAGPSDERQRARELGAWVIASAAALAIPGVATASWFETWGPRGLQDENGRMPAADPIDALTALAGGTLLSGDSPDGLLWAIGARTPDADTFLIANLDRVPRTVLVGADESQREVHLAPGSWDRLVVKR